MRFKVRQNIGSSFCDRILQEMNRIQELRSKTYTVGDSFKFEIKDFSWLLKKLTGNQDSRFFGCELNVVETVLFKNGRASKLIKTEPDGFVTTI